MSFQLLTCISDSMSVLTNTLLATSFSNVEHCSDWGEEFTLAQVYFLQVFNQSLGNKAWIIFWEETQLVKKNQKQQDSFK